MKLCVYLNVKREFQEYSYKVEKRTGDIQPLIEDDNNHWIDALRYAVERLHRKGALLDEEKVDKPQRLVQPKDYRGIMGEDESWRV
jgi:phage terminase large subunit